MKTRKTNITVGKVSNFRAIVYSANLRAIKQIAQVIPSDRRRTRGAFASIHGNGQRRGGRRLGGFRRRPWSRLHLSPMDGRGRLPFFPTNEPFEREGNRGTATSSMFTVPSYSTSPRVFPILSLQGALLNHIRFSRQLFRY